MKKTIGNLALVVGVIVSSLAAVEGQRVSRAAAVDSKLVGEVLHTSVASHLEEQYPEIYVWLDRTIEAGTVLDQGHIDWLTSSGVETILVQRRAVNTLTLPVDEDLVGRVFAEPVVLTEEQEVIKVGRLISEQFNQRVAASELTSILLEEKVADPDKEGATIRREVEWQLDENAPDYEGAPPIGSRLRREISLPVQLKTSSYVDESVLERLKASGIETAEVKIPRSWTWQDWNARWIFIIGIGITLLGVLMKRSKLDPEALAEEKLEVAKLADSLQSLESTVETLTSRVDDMDAASIHRELDPMLSGPVYAIAEGRNSIRSAHGVRVFASVMDAFSRGERKLNRTWSAAVDGYVDEARKSLHAALPALREAREALPGTHAPRPVGFDSNFDEDGTSMPLPPDVPIAPDERHWSDD